MTSEYIIYCDESDEKGEYFSNFYGGTLVRSEHYEEVVAKLRECKAAQNLHQEVKWTKITERYEKKYTTLIDAFFDLVKAGKIKVRIMFTQNTVVAKGLTPQHVEEKYFILYYQFLKHAFGLNVSPYVEGGVNLRVYPDQIPDNKERVEQFRGFLMGLAGSPAFRDRKIRMKREDIADVNSKQHEILQCLDIVLGAMSFRLNDKNKEKTAKEGTRRGSRTKAKERVYRHILSRIQDIYPNFNIGRSTGQPTNDCRWALIHIGIGCLRRLKELCFQVASTRRRGPHSRYINIPRGTQDFASYRAPHSFTPESASVVNSSNHFLSRHSNENSQIFVARNIFSQGFCEGATRLSEGWLNQLSRDVIGKFGRQTSGRS